MNYDEMFEFEKINGGYALTSYLKKDDQSIQKIEIPSEYRGEPVTVIGERAFEYAAYLDVVNIPPEGLLSIGEGAFGACEDLPR